MKEAFNIQLNLSHVICTLYCACRTLGYRYGAWLKCIFYVAFSYRAQTGLQHTHLQKLEPGHLGSSKL